MAHIEKATQGKQTEISALHDGAKTSYIQSSRDGEYQ
jgi:hypothetical protein